MFKKTKIIKIVLIMCLLLLPLALSGEDNDINSVREAIRLSKSGDYQGAIIIFSELLKKDDYMKNPAIHFHLGLAYYSSGRYDEALKEFITTETLDPTKGMPYYFTGLIYEAKALSEKDPQQVRALKTKALSSWQDFIKFADADKRDKSKIEIAEKHISLLKEELSEK
ncbi:MAG: tetratricopeptide repeat protein [bacterium]|jgi:tetratricopeptide (TPR) repeat protein|nr:tetratricopeptide repeat protein [bacterium]